MSKKTIHRVPEEKLAMIREFRQQARDLHRSLQEVQQRFNVAVFMLTPEVPDEDRERLEFDPETGEFYIKDDPPQEE